MRLLVTGANGFLGRHVVQTLARAGHPVVALVRPAADLEDLAWGASVEVRRADLRNAPDLAGALQGVGAVIHLAASMSGSDFARFSETVTGTEKLLAAMSDSGVGRLVLCSSFSVYDWSHSSGTVDENLPLLQGPAAYTRGGYAAAKLWQERLARRMSLEHGWQLTVVRPGFIWGRGNECPRGSIGPAVGSFQLVLSAGRQLPFTHVVNSADCFRAVIENPASIGQTLNLVDGYPLSAWRFMGECLKHRPGKAVRVYLPHWLLRHPIGIIHRIGRYVLGPRLKLPSVLVPARFAQGYRPLEFSTKKLVEVLGWHPPLTLEECFARTFLPES